MATPDSRNAFTDIDRAADPAAFVRVLDALTGLDAIRTYKQRTFELLGVAPEPASSTSAAGPVTTFRSWPAWSGQPAGSWASTGARR